jgi:P-type E1-E2 ATPase
MSDGYGAACAPLTMEIPDDMATTRDLLDAAARWVAEHKGMSPRAAKAYVHAMPLGELVNLPAGELVPGDIVMIESGDRVPADGRLLFANSLEIEEAALTGESQPSTKDIACARVSLRYMTSSSASSLTCICSSGVSR